MLESTGHVDVTRDEDMSIHHWTMAPATLAQTRTGEWSAIGAWGQGALRALRQALLDAGLPGFSSNKDLFLPVRLVTADAESLTPISDRSRDHADSRCGYFAPGRMCVLSVRSAKPCRGSQSTGSSRLSASTCTQAVGFPAGRLARPAPSGSAGASLGSTCSEMPKTWSQGLRPGQPRSWPSTSLPRPKRASR